MNLYFIHNGFTAYLIKKIKDEEAVFAIINKDAKGIARSCPWLKEKQYFYFNKLLPAIGLIFSIIRSDKIFVSNCLHPRMIFLWPFIHIFRKKILVLDEGVASINRDFSNALRKAHKNSIHYYFNLFLSRLGKKRLLISVFPNEFVADNFKWSSHVGCVEKFNDCFPVNSVVVSGGGGEKDLILVLGSGVKRAKEIRDIYLSSGYLQCPDNYLFLYKDHPLMSGGADDLQTFPETYIEENIGRISSVVGGVSSSLYLIKCFHPNVSVFCVLENKLSYIGAAFTEIGIVCCD